MAGGAFRRKETTCRQAAGRGSPPTRRKGPSARLDESPSPPPLFPCPPSITQTHRRLELRAIPLSQIFPTKNPDLRTDGRNPECRHKNYKIYLALGFNMIYL